MALAAAKGLQTAVRGRLEPRPEVLESAGVRAAGVLDADRSPRAARSLRRPLLAVLTIAEVLRRIDEGIDSRRRDDQRVAGLDFLQQRSHDRLPKGGPGPKAMAVPASPWPLDLAASHEGAEWT